MDLATIFASSSDNSRTPNRYLHLTTSGNPSLATNPSNDNLHHNQTSKSAIESLENIKVNSSFLEKDPNSYCPICEKEFVLDSEVKMLPCRHVYHSECILQWLEMKNTCLVCQFQLPTQEDEDYDLLGLPRGENFIGTIISEELLNDEEEEEEETEEDMTQFQGPLGPVVVRPNLTMMNRWQLDITIVSHFRSQNRDFLALTSVSVTFSEIMDCLFIKFSQLVMENEIESVELLLWFVHTGENGHGVGVMGMANGWESLGDEWDVM